MEKTCIDCRDSKSLDQFYAHPYTADGRMGVCKECHKARVILRRRTNPMVQQYDRERYQRPARKAFAMATAKQWRIDSPEGYRAQTAVGNALRDKRLFKGPCEVCGTTKWVHGHHKDYSKPLDVQWLCAIHHHRHHAES